MKESLESLVVEGLSYMKAGSEVAKKATADIMKDVSNPILKDALEEGNQQAELWAERIDTALEEVGGSEAGENKILEAHFEVSKKIREKAEDDYSRDLGIISAGQMALHYWIASFGTIRAYAESLGFTDVAQSMEACLSEAKTADERHTEIAFQMMGVAPALSGEMMAQELAH